MWLLQLGPQLRPRVHLLSMFSFRTSSYCFTNSSSSIVILSWRSVLPPQQQLQQQLQ
jgi:hypothetical protein